MSNLQVANIVNPTTADTTPTDNLSKQVCRAWVNFNGTGTVAIRDSFNVSSITDNGTGDYTVNYSSALSDINNSISMSAGNQGTTFSSVCSIHTLSLTSTRFSIKNTSDTPVDRDTISAQVFSN